MNDSNFQILENNYESKEINYLNNSSQNTIELNQNDNNSNDKYRNEEDLDNDNPMFNINTLKSLRISHSIESSKNSQSLIDVLKDNKIINDKEENEKNNENDMNINNIEKKKNNAKNIINIKEENNSRNLSKNEFSPIYTNNIQQNNIYNKFKIEEIFKERFEEKTKSYKQSYQNQNRLQNNNDDNNDELNNLGKKLKTQTFKKNYITIPKNKNSNKQNKLKNNDSLSIEQDSIEINDSKHKKLVLDTFDIKNTIDQDDKNVLVSELDLDISDSAQEKNCNEIKIKSFKLEKAVDNKYKKDSIGKNKTQKKINDKIQIIKKKIYPTRKINLNNNSKKNVIQFYKKLDSDKNNNNININKYEKIHSSAPNKFQKRKILKNSAIKQSLNNSNISSNQVKNTSSKKNNSNSSAFTISRKFSYKPKPKYSCRSFHNDEKINLKKYYRLETIDKNNINVDLYNNIKNILMNNRNITNKFKKVLNITTLNTNSSNDNISSKNSYKRNNSFITKRKNNLNNNNDNKNKKKFDIPKGHYSKISIKNKIPIKRNTQINKYKNSLYLNNNNIKNKKNSFNNSIIRSNSCLCKNDDQNKTYLISYNNNYYKLNTNQNNLLENIYNPKCKKKIIITAYNSFSNNILALPNKISLSKYKKYINNNKNMNLNYHENPLLLVNQTNESKKPGIYLYNKKIMKKSLNNNKSKDNSNLLTDYDLKVNNKTLFLNKRSSEKNILKQINYDRIRNKNYIRNFSYKSLILNPFKPKENNSKRFLTNKSSKTKLMINPNKNFYSYRSCNNSVKKFKYLIKEKNCS